ncbi:MAG: hypothetical protein IKU45_00490, partial [Clostridia bacterium]|nr:hypothetical protein [Clostridia bacterium]
MTQKLKRKTITFKTMALLLALSMLIPLMPLRAIAATSEEDLTSNKTEQTTVNEKEPESPLDAIIVEEDVSKRGRNEKHFLCDDGSYIAVSYSEDVHEVVNNEWVDIEYDVGESDGEISPVDEDIKVKFANNTNSSKLVKIDADGYKISWTVEAETEEGEGINKVKLSKESKSAIKTTKEINKQNKEKIKAESKNTYAQVLSYKQMAELAIEKEKNADVENNEKVLYANASIEEYNREQIQSAASYAQSMVEYKDAFGEGLTLRYLLTPGKINEEIVLDSYSGFKSYSMVINTDGLTPVVSENGSVALTDSEGNAVMNIAAPYMYDAIDAISENVSVTATQESKKEWRITYTPDQEWLKDTNRVYPVVIDPEVHTSKNRTDILDAFVYCGQTEYSNNNLPYLRVGYTGYRISNIAYWAVNNLPTIAANSYITGAGLHIRFLDDTEETENIVLYSTTGTLNTNTLNWDNKPTLVSFLDNQATLPTNYWVNFCSQSLGDIIADKYRRGENSLVLAI